MTSPRALATGDQDVEIGLQDDASFGKVLYEISEVKDMVSQRNNE
jgi:hypothetical protein